MKGGVAIKGITKKVLVNTDEISLNEYHCEIGGEIQLHTHPESHIAYVVAGVMNLVVAGKNNILRSGDFLLIPAEIEHKALFMENTRFIETNCRAVISSSKTSLELGGRT